MFSLCHFVLLLSIYSVPGLILPITKSDGSLDVSSLLSHIALLEQSIGDKASPAELVQLRSDLAASQKELADTKSALAQLATKLDTNTAELKDAKAALKRADIEIELLKNSVDAQNKKSQDITGVQLDVSHLKTEVFQLQSLHNKTGEQDGVPGGTTFIRWGRTSCPADSTVVYKGYTGGSFYLDKASAANILCLPDQPIYANHTTVHAGQAEISHIYGTEYDSFYTGAPLKNLYNEDMPCVVCENKQRHSAMMLPARNQCFPGWTLEYSGYLMGPSFNHASGEYICVDSDAEAIPGGAKDQNDNLMYHVEGRCGVLPCPPYHDRWELTCAVCSK